MPTTRETCVALLREIVDPVDALSDDEQARVDEALHITDGAARIEALTALRDELRNG